jgi:hypothetical protein
VMRLLHETMASVGLNILHPICVSLKIERKILPACLWLSPRSLTPSCILFLHSYIAVELATEASAQDATTTWYLAALRVMDAEDRATLAERGALERVSRVEVLNAVALASTREDAEGLVQKITLLEGELTEERWAR